MTITCGFGLPERVVHGRAGPCVRLLEHLDRTSGPALVFAHGGVLVAAQVYAGKVKLEDAMKALLLTGDGGN